MPYTATNLAELKVSLKQRWDGEVFWTDDEARIALNESLRDWNLLVGRWRTRLAFNTVAPVAGVPVVDYVLGASMTYAMRVTMSTGTPLIPTSILELDLARPTWRRETVASGGDVPAVPTLWAPQSLTTLLIWPALNSVIVNGLVVDGVAATPVLVEDGDPVDAGEEIVDILVDYALHCAAFKEAGPRWRATLPFWQAFLQAAAEENSLLKTNQKFRRMAGLDRRRDLQPTKDVPTRLDQTAQQVGPGGQLQ